MRAHAALLLAWGCALGCDARPSDETDPAWGLSSQPADGSSGAARAGRLVVQLDRMIEPRTATHSHVHLRSGAVYWPITVRSWPATSELWIDIDPAAPLEPNVSYELEVEGLVDLDGHAQPEAFVAQFETGLELGPVAQLPEPIPTVAGAHALLRARCATARCHGGVEPSAQLDLSSANGIADTAIGAPSQLLAGTTGSEGARGALSLAGLPIIDVVSGRGQPATSYLIYKVLGGSHILGQRMPAGGRALSDADVTLLSEWILLGAPSP